MILNNNRTKNKKTKDKNKDKFLQVSNSKKKSNSNNNNNSSNYEPNNGKNWKSEQTKFNKLTLDFLANREWRIENRDKILQANPKKLLCKAIS